MVHNQSQHPRRGIFHPELQFIAATIITECFPLLLAVRGYGSDLRVDLPTYLLILAYASQPIWIDGRATKL